jgi:selenide,water dikinase
VLKVSTELAICFTADFITPLVDDPRTWGRIAAANALSDVFAMGGAPLAALNLVCWPSCLPIEMLHEVLAGGAAAAAEAGCLVVGGHTIADQEPKYGMAVIGTLHPHRILRNRGAQPGDALYLTKPLGTGIIATALKADLAAAEHLAAAVESMTTLNGPAASAATAAGARAATDVTGFGLAGHLTEMLGDEGLGCSLFADTLPWLPGAADYLAMGLIPGGAYRNRETFGPRVSVPAGLRDGLEMLLFDPQTSGGLLVALPAEGAEAFEQQAAARDVQSWQIGRFDATPGIRVVE